MSDLPEAPETELPQEDLDAGDETPRNEDSPPAEGAESSEKDDKSDKRVKDAQRALHQKTQELAALKERMAKLEGMVEVGMRPNEQPSPQGDRLFSYLEDDSVANEVLDDGKNVVKLVKSVLGDMFKILNARDDAFREMIREQSPDMLAVRDRIAELEKDPDYQGFSREQLAVIAKKTSGESGVRSPRSGPGNRKPGLQSKSEAERLADDYFNRIYGEDR